MDDQKIVLLRPRNQLLIKAPGRAFADRIHGIGNDHEFRPLRLPGKGIQIRQPAVFPLQLIKRQIRSGQPGAHGENRIARIGHQHFIPGIEQAKADMSDSFLRAIDGGDFVRFELYPITAGESVLHSADQLWQIPQGIFIILRPFRSRADRFHHEILRRKIRRSHREIIHRFPLSDQLSLLFIQQLKNAFFILLHPICEHKLHPSSLHPALRPSPSHILPVFSQDAPDIDAPHFQGLSASPGCPAPPASRKTDR